MTKDMNVWAIKLNNHIVEFRATIGPAKIIRSTITKPKAVMTESWDYSVYPPKRIEKFRALVLRQTTMVGGRFLGKISFLGANKLLSIHFPKNEDVVKLSGYTRNCVLSPSWRKANL